MTATIQVNLNGVTVVTASAVVFWASRRLKSLLRCQANMVNLNNICIKCLQEKPWEEFPWKNKLRGKKQTICKRCMVERSNRWYYANRDTHIKNVRMNTIEYRNEVSEYAWNYLATHPCVDCGEMDPVVLEFDHVRGEKFDAISTMVGRGFPLERIKEEIAKCEVRCSNCHRRKTAKDRGWFRWSR